MSETTFGAVEAGGTKFVCLVGRRPGDIEAQSTFPTTDPASTLDSAVAFFRDHRSQTGGSLPAVGIASFGPVELRRNQAEYGHITVTPKPGWSGADIAGVIGSELDVPIGFDTDVNGAALAEGRWGATAGLDSFAYVTVGTGVGVGVVIAGRVVHGLIHPEVGHVTVRRAADDGFAGSCPYHGDCLEGMVSGPALAARFGKPGPELDRDEQDQAAGLVATYLADGLRNLIYVAAPERIVVGGGVAELPGLHERLRDRLISSLGGYPGLPEHASEAFLVPPALAPLSGAYGGLVLAEQAVSTA